MSTRSPVLCPVCNEKMGPDQELEHHLVRDHTPRELAKKIATDWEADELEDAA